MGNFRIYPPPVTPTGHKWVREYPPTWFSEIPSSLPLDSCVGSVEFPISSEHNKGAVMGTLATAAVAHLRKAYAGRYVVDDVSFEAKLKPL